MLRPTPNCIDTYVNRYGVLSDRSAMLATIDAACGDALALARLAA